MQNVPIDSETAKKLMDAATKAFNNSYAPYSNFNVGAALITEKGNTFTGTNVENISYGLTNCAERVAIGNAVTQEGPAMKIKVIAITCRSKIPLSPCGACRQVINQFGPMATVIYLSPMGQKQTTLDQLLPDAFNNF